MLRLNLISLLFICILTLSCGEDRYLCDEPIQQFAPTENPDEGGYVSPDCKSTGTNGEAQ